MVSYNRPQVLRRTLESIYRQRVPFDFEVIVVDDGMINSQDACKEFPVRWKRIATPDRRHTPAEARNAAYRMVESPILISQSDDVMHRSHNTIERLVQELTEDTFVLARVLNVDETGKIVWQKRRRAMTGSDNQRPLFFLGSVYMSHVKAIGGCDEELGAAYEDSWFSKCLMHGRKLTPVFADHIVGWHQHHDRNYDLNVIEECRRMYWHKVRVAKRTNVWCTPKGPWK